ncbi:hypothetical protein M409DRAFT_28664 [Zasmidium cellare ATCC 36951]|uniref:Uncharacterized protein n=1 Tax=Zasmidium cellare ATCC 36951 TaxID=1080233 RepID=A0A6A6C183_ZASCE|nr:uncharacterized protein M409DRAFT_28664 [Zasmidium cellare ATCC 36951]KAF2160781.1 hypothetical protein M409DRAFT_28664 [Zasmidium cellare ATCC 36951]
MPNGMLNPNSYFPPVGAWSSRLPSPAVPAPAPLLPTPIPTAIPSTLGGTLNELPPHVDLEEMPKPPPATCSCPVTDTCIAESLALLLGSFKLLCRVVLELRELEEWRDVVPMSTYKAIETALARFETCMRKLFAPLLESKETDMEDWLLQQWLRPVQRQTYEEDVCSRVRRRVDEASINAIDTFPPMQHILHMLLVRYEFGSPSFRAVLEMFQGGNVESGTKLLLEAHRHLVQFAVKSDNAYKESLLDDLGSWVDSLARRIEDFDTLTAMKDMNL